jgi:hypothetical protein
VRISPEMVRNMTTSISHVKQGSRVTLPSGEALIEHVREAHGKTHKVMTLPVRSQSMPAQLLTQGSVPAIHDGRL